MNKKTPLSALVVIGFAGFVAYQFAASDAGVTPPASAAQVAGLAQRDLDDPTSPVLGDPHGDVTIVEFFDYRCPYCRMMQPTIERELATDRHIRLVLKEWPVFGGPSVEAARTALAAAWQGKYGAVHDALFAAPLPFDHDVIRRITQQAGVDMSRLDRDMTARSGELDRMLAQNQAAAQALGARGTPTFLVGDTMIPGAVSPADLRSVIADARAKSGAAR